MPWAGKIDLAVEEDGDLARLAQSGDEAALSELMKRYKTAVRLCSVSAGGSGLEKEDLIQEGMIGLFTAVQTYRAEKGASFRTYAFLCIKRHIVSAERSAGREKHIPLNNYISLDDETNVQAAAAAASSNVIDPEDMIVSREKIGAVRNVVEKCLSLPERGILSMYLTGMSYAAIADAMKVSVKTIDNSLQKIRKRLVSSFDG